MLSMPIKKKWFDMIRSGEKKEEYREIKPYWISRLCCTKNLLDGCKDFRRVELVNGYGRKAERMIVLVEDVDFGYGKEEWGAEPGKEYFVFKIEKVLYDTRITQQR